MTERTFTDREQQFMHDTLREIARTGDATLAEKALAFIDAPYVRYSIQCSLTDDELARGFCDTHRVHLVLDSMNEKVCPVRFPQAIDSAERYVVVGPAASDDSPTGQAWHIQDTATGHGVIVNERCWYATQADAQAAVDKLNNGGAS